MFYWLLFRSNSDPRGLWGKMRNCGMRNAESRMWNQKCGMTLIGRGDKPRDCGLH